MKKEIARSTARGVDLPKEPEQEVEGNTFPQLPYAWVAHI